MVWKEDLPWVPWLLWVELSTTLVCHELSGVQRFRLYSTQLNSRGHSTQLNSKKLKYNRVPFFGSLEVFFFGREKGEPVDGKVRGRMPTRSYNRQSFPWDFLFSRSPKKCVLTDRLECLENSETLTESLCTRMKRIRSLNVPFFPSHSSSSITESDWVCWGWCSHR